MSGSGRIEVTRRPNVGIVQRMAMTMAAKEAQGEVSLPLAAMARLSARLSLGSRRTGVGDGVGHRISSDLRSCRTLYAMIGITRMKRMTASADPIPGFCCTKLCV